MPRERSGAILKENHEDIVLAKLAVGLVVNRMTGRGGALGKATGLISGGGDQDQVARVLKETEGEAAGGMVCAGAESLQGDGPDGGMME